MTWEDEAKAYFEKNPDWMPRWALGTHCLQESMGGQFCLCGRLRGDEIHRPANLPVLAT